MPNIFDLCSDLRSFDSLSKVKEELLTKVEKEKEEQRKHWEKNYRKKHIFSSYEEALDWLMTHKGRGIEWHTSTIFYQEDKQNFKSYEQDSDYSGIIHYNVIRYYTKEELLKGIQEHIEYCNKKYPEKANTKWWLDKYGKLSYVSI